MGRAARVTHHRVRDDGPNRNGREGVRALGLSVGLACVTGCATVRLSPPPVPPVSSYARGVRAETDTVIVEAVDGPARVDVVRPARIERLAFNDGDTPQLGVLHERLLCHAPCVARLPPGAHLLRFTLRDFDEHERRFGPLADRTDDTLNPTTRAATVVALDNTRGPRRVLVALGAHRTPTVAREVGAVVLPIGISLLVLAPAIGLLVSPTSTPSVAGAVTSGVLGMGATVGGVALLTRPSQVQPASARYEDLAGPEVPRPW